MEDNAFVRCADPDLLSTSAERLAERILQQRANYWTTRLTPPFSARERAICQLHYQWSVAQIEFARDVIFRRRARLHALFSARSRLGSQSAALPRPGISSGAASTAAITASSKLSWTGATNEGFPVLRSYYKSSYVKQYEKGNLLLRTETCLNDTYHLNIGRKLANLPALK